MKHKTLTAALALALAGMWGGAAQAATFQGLSATSGVAAPSALGSVVINVAGIGSYDEIGSSDNIVLSYNIGALSTVTSISWDFSLTAFAPSWLSEMQVTFTGSDLFGSGVTFTPSDTSGSGTEFFSGSASLEELGLAFQVGEDGILRVEFHEDYVDGLGPDGIWNSGTLTVNYVSAVPEPTTYGLMALGLGVLGVAARRRKAQ